MLVSIVIPVRRDLHIRACLAGVLSQVCEARREVIVVENDKQRRLEGIIRSYPVIYLCAPQPGSYRARNAGLNLAQGEIVVFLDADCVPAGPGWLDGLLRGFSDEGVGGVAGRIEKGAGRGWVARCQREFLLQDGLQYLRPIHPAPYAPTGNAAYRRKVLTEIGGFDGQFFSGGDVDLSWRVQLAGCRLVYAPGAAVSHVCRERWSDYFRQYYKYGLGQVLLFRKYRGLTGRRVLWNDYPFKGLARTLARLLTRGLYELAVEGRAGCALGCLLSLTEHGALLLSAAAGSLRYRVIYI